MEVMTNAAITSTNRSQSKNQHKEESPAQGPAVVSVPADVDRSKIEFFVVLAHELRSPLAAVRFAAEIMQQCVSDNPTLVQCYGVIARQVNHIDSLLENLFDVGRVANGSIQLHLQLVEMIEIVRQSVEMSRPLFDARRHRLTVSLPQQPVQLWGDPTRLVQVIVNLLNNAAKYTNPGGCISLTLTKSEVDVTLRIRDNGLGIAPEMLVRIFDLFAQAGRSSDNYQGGLGIGLALVRNLVELHGGIIQAFSDGPEKGSEFVVCLPALSEMRRQGVPIKEDNGIPA